MKVRRIVKRVALMLAAISLFVAPLNFLVRPVSAEPVDKIIYHESIPGGQQLALMNPDGTGYQPLPGSGTDTLPKISPDGTKIAFQVAMPGGGFTGLTHIFVMNSDGSNRVDLTPGPGRANQPAWSPDGSKIAFLGKRNNVNGMYVMNSDGSDVHLVLVNARWPSWSPDGTRLSFMATVGSADEIGTVKADGTEMTILTGGLNFDGFPAWSSDNRIAWESNCNCGAPSTLSIINPDGTNRVDLVQGLDSVNGPPQWSPDSSKLVYAGGWGVYHVTDSQTGETQAPNTDDHYVQNPYWGGLVTLSNYAPIVHPIADASIDFGQNYSYNGVFSDPDSSSWTATVNYGDGTGTQALPLSGNNFALNHTYTQAGTHVTTVSVTDDGQMVGSAKAYITVAPNPVPQLTALTPALPWIGPGALPQPGLKVDLLAEVYAGDTLVSSGQLDSQAIGFGVFGQFSSAQQYSLPFGSFAPVAVPTGTPLKIKLSARNACVGSVRNSGTIRLWLNDSQADSKFGATIDTASSDYFLHDGFVLANAAGPGPKQSLDLQVGAKCSAFKSFGTWSVTL